MKWGVKYWLIRQVPDPLPDTNKSMVTQYGDIPLIIDPLLQLH